ncbi:MAG: dephospho-CoA kinase [Alphaproteobacteria bacterium PRO2]|nr:dephospho-CoA kinase [Alphaproteobacteria bacterium PRO2]
MIVIGLTGSIGMGKSTAAAMFESLRIPVHEADDEVHKLLSPGGKGARAVGAAFPYFQFPQIYGRKTKSGVRAIKRKELGKIVFHDEKQRKKLEKILHPLVRAAQADFIRKHKINGTKIVVLDIPLLFETGGENRVDYTLVVTAPRAVQRRRVLERPGMDEKRFRAILKQQMPDGEKRARADYVAHTGLGRAQTMKEIKAALADIKKREQ